MNRLTDQQLWGEWNCSNAIHEVPNPYRRRLSWRLLAFCFVCGVAIGVGIWFAFQ